MSCNNVNNPNPNPDSAENHFWGVDGDLWRHTIGRASNALLIPVHLLASVFQAGKVVGKVVALPFTYSIVGIRWLATKEGYQGSMSLRGIAIDACGFIKLLMKAVICFKNVIVAPGVKSLSVDQHLEGNAVILSGELHDDERFQPSTCKTSQVCHFILTGKPPKGVRVIRGNLKAQE